MSMWLIIMVVPALVLALAEAVHVPSVAERVYISNATEQCVKARKSFTPSGEWSEAAARKRCRKAKQDWYRGRFG